MPKVTIREVDLTGAETEQYVDYAVLVPGITVRLTDASTAIDEVLITSTEWFNQSFAQDYEALDVGFRLAKEIVKSGLPVFYKSAYTIVSGRISPNPFKDPITGQPETFTSQDKWYAKFYKPFMDKGRYDLRFITIGGFAQVEANAQGEEHLQPLAAQAALRCAAERGDAVAVLDVPRDKVNLLQQEGESASWTQAFTLTTSDLIDQWVQQEYGSVVAEVPVRNGVSWTTAEQKTETVGRYGAIFAPSCSAMIDGTNKTVFGSLVYLKAFAKMIVGFPSWFAAAGAIRGTSGFSQLTPSIELGDADIDILQRRSTSEVDGKTVGENHIATNVIANIRPYGYVVWGNRTMHPLSTPTNGVGAVPQLVASSFLNIRQLCIDIKKTLYRACRRFTFDPNSDTLWFNFKNAVTPLLDDMKANQGINGYQIVKIRTNKKALLVARIKIIPIEAVEDFDLTVELTDSIESVSVNE